MKTVFASLILVLTTAAAAQEANPETAASIARGQSKSAVCAACHGAKGVSINPLWPNIAGQKRDYLKKALTDFKEGRRKNELMSPISMTLSAQDQNDLANYFSSL